MDNNIQKIGLCGFKNIGNTCYMNSILQLLIHSKLLINFLLSKTNPFINTNTDTDINFESEFINYIKNTALDNISEQKKFKLQNYSKKTINKLDIKEYITNSLTYKLAEIINIIIYKGNSCITPYNFKCVIDNKIPSFKGMGQQDSHELLNGIFDTIIEETGIDSEPIINNIPQIVIDYINYINELKKKLSQTNIIDEKKKIIEEFNNYTKNINNNNVLNKYNGLSYMSQVFKNKRSNNLDTLNTGYNPMIFNLLTFTVDTFICTECNYQSCKYQYHTIFMLHIKPTLLDCFKQFTEEEIINRKCDICKNNKAVKKSKIWKPATTIYIELCRFINMPDGRLVKNNMFVDIPHNLDISEFCDLSMQTDDTITFKYKLRGISNHLSGMQNINGGHYTADCLSIIDDKTWYHFDDSNVSIHSNFNIDMSSAYILLYEME